LFLDLAIFSAQDELRATCAAGIALMLRLPLKYSDKCDVTSLYHFHNYSTDFDEVA
jgi:hypothetical protein